VTAAMRFARVLGKMFGELMRDDKRLSIPAYWILFAVGELEKDESS